jgi:hypothetical protein
LIHLQSYYFLTLQKMILKIGYLNCLLKTCNLNRNRMKNYYR